MREHLYRAKRKDNGEIVIGSLIVTDSGETLIVSGWDFGLEFIKFAHSVIPETVGQYTGLLDKNGMKIFEGDICNLRKIRYEIVFFDCGLYAKIYKTKKLKYGHTVYKTCYELIGNLCEKGLEVVGNIHDNPELLNEKQAEAEDG